MAEADVYTKNYISRNDVFADIFNFFIYGGDQVIRADSLCDENIEEIAIVPLGEEDVETTQRYRDVLKSCVIKRGEDASYVLLGVENQTHVHYAMPVRCMIYDALQYSKQTRQAAASHRQDKDTHLTAAEFLSGFTRDDTLTPVITLVVYFGAERWDAPRSLHQMFGKGASDERLMRFAPDYPINLIEPALLSEDQLARFITDFRQVMEFLKYSNDKQRISALLSEGSPYESLSTTAALVLNSCAGMGIKINQKEEKMNMCKAIQEIRQEGVEKGRAEGEVRGEYNTKVATARNFLAMGVLSIEQIAQGTGLSVGEVAAL